MLYASNYNLIPLAVNISRVYEIAKTGNYTVKIIPTTNCSKNDVGLLNEFYGFIYTDNPDMLIELAYSPNDVLNCFTTQKHETLPQINERLNTQPLPSVSDELNNPCIALLKIAIERLQLGAYDVMIIINVAKTIAQLGLSNTIKVEHMAEAIQYRSVRE